MQLKTKSGTFVLLDEVTTRHQSLRDIAFRRILKECRSSDDEMLQAFGEDTDAAWRYAVVLSVTSGGKLPPVSAVTPLLMEGFGDWLDMPAAITEELFKAANRLYYPETPEEQENGTAENPTAGDSLTATA